MFSDTHCHLSYVTERGANLSDLLARLDEEGFRFVMDIGTRPGDLLGRMSIARSAWNGESERGTGSGTETGGTDERGHAGRDALPGWLWFSAGLWPDARTIASRAESLAALESDVSALLAGKPELAALGECGLDRYWNGEAGRDRPSGEDGPGTMDTAGEEELFSAQLELAERKGLAVVVHSRDAFDETRSILANSLVSRGVIHCFAYGVAEARAFLDLGYHVSFPGTITWGKKQADKDRIAELLRYVPRDRLLLETDSPYLAPAPHRGTANTPLLVRHCYETAAEFLGIEAEGLARIVFDNARALFSVREGRG